MAVFVPKVYQKLIIHIVTTITYMLFRCKMPLIAHLLCYT